MDSLFCFQASIFICHSGKAGEHLSSTPESSSVDAQAHPDTLHKVYLSSAIVLYYLPQPGSFIWTNRVDFFLPDRIPCSTFIRTIRTTGCTLHLLLPTRDLYPGHPDEPGVFHMYYVPPETFVWIIRTNRVWFTCTTSHQRPSSWSSGKIGCC